MRSDSKRDGIKSEHVIFTQACLRNRQRRASYVYVSASAGQIWSWGRGEEREIWKNVRTCGKILATPLISLCAFAICVSIVNICISSFLAWFSMKQIIYKHDDLGYSKNQTALLWSSTLDLVDIYLWQPKISSGWQVEVLEQQSSSFWGSAVHMCCK